MAYKKILFRRDPAASWTSENPVLSAGEVGLETDTGKIKIGNGSSVWTALSYFVGNLPGATLDAIGDVTITSVQNGDFLRYNGSASVWINDPVNLSTDTVGSYVESLVAGTGVTLTNNSGEGATPTVAIGQSVATSASPTFAKITISSTPSATTDAVTKSYVDNIASGINWHEAVVYATTAVLPDTPTYDNGAGGVGSTLTAGSNARLMVDGLNTSTGNRILVKNQSIQTQNGIYDVTAQGSVSVPWVLTRAADFNQDTLAGAIDTGEAVYVRLGNSNAGTGHVLTSIGTGDGDRHIPGTDNFVFTQFSGLTATVAGAGLTTNGTSISVGTASSGRIVVSSDDIDLATVAQSNSTAADTLSFAKTVNVDSYGRVTGVVSASVDLSSKANLAGPTFTGTVTLPSTTSIGDVSSTEIGYLNNVTSAIQTQIDTKAPLASPTFTGTVTLPSGTVTSAMITDGTIVNGDISSSAAIDDSKLATISCAGKVSNSATTATATAGNSTIVARDASGNFAAGTITAALSGNASTATTLATTRAIEISGDVTGTANFDGSAAINIVTTIAANSVALGTDTTGNYVNDLTSGTGVTITHTPSEGSSPTVAIGQAVGTSASVTFGQVTTSGDLVVGGNLTVSGTTTSVNTETLTIDDNIVVLNNNVTGTPTENAGIEIERGTSANVLVRWNETNDKWEATNDGTTYGNLVTTADVGTVSSSMIANVSTNAQAASYTLVLSDKDKIVEMGVGSANNLTVPLNSSVAFPVGSQINILQTGSGQTTVVAAAGVTINATPGLKIRAQWSYATLIKRATDTWVLVGDISA